MINLKNEIPKHRKKAKHQPPKKQDHKHNKIKCIVIKKFTYGNKPHTWNMLGWYCDICGKVEGEVIEFCVDLKEKYPNLEVKEKVE